MRGGVAYIYIYIYGLRVCKGLGWKGTAPTAEKLRKANHEAQG